MRKFFKRRWHGIPIGVISAVLAVCLLTSSVFAGFAGWYTFTTGTADVTVVEAIEVKSFSGDGTVTGNQAAGYIWTVSLYPGENKSLFPTIENKSPADLELVTDVGYVPAGLTVTGHGDISLEIPATITGLATQSFEIKVIASGAAAPGTYTISFDFQRQ